MSKASLFARHINEIVSVAEGGPTQRDPDVVRSWLRCLNDHSLDPEHKGEARIVPEYVLNEHQQDAEDLMAIARFGMEDLYRRLNSMGYVMLLTDQLGVTVEELREALGDPSDGPPDFEAAAAQLGVTVEELKEALGVPEGGAPPGGGPSGGGGAPAP